MNRPKPTADAVAPFLVARPDGFWLDVSVVPQARRTEAVGLHDGALRVRLAAPPVDGAANEALRRWLADGLGVPLARVSLLRGASSRRKRWHLAVTLAQSEAWLAALRAAGLDLDTAGAG